MESCSGTRRKLTPRCIVNHNTSRRSAIDAYIKPKLGTLILLSQIASLAAVQSPTVMAIISDMSNLNIAVGSKGFA